jgi:hypothetical protein
MKIKIGQFREIADILLQVLSEHESGYFYIFSSNFIKINHIENFNAKVRLSVICII